MQAWTLFPRRPKYVGRLFGRNYGLGLTCNSVRRPGLLQAGVKALGAE